MPTWVLLVLLEEHDTVNVPPPELIHAADTTVTVSTGMIVGVGVVVGPVVTGVVVVVVGGGTTGGQEETSNTVTPDCGKGLSYGSTVR